MTADRITPTDERATAVDRRRESRAPNRRQIDQSCRQVLLLWYGSSVVWLLVGTVLAGLASVKLHTPWFLGGVEWLTFGRVRPAHLNAMIYGWASMSGIATQLWLTARLSKHRLPWRPALFLAGLYWNALIAAGVVWILAVGGTSIEWLEFPWWVSIPLGVGFVLVLLVTVKMVAGRQPGHIYVSQWYLLGAAIWFPILYIAATILMHGGAAVNVVRGSANWWYAHNVLGLWLTPVGVAAAYYFIPKVIGRPIYSYYLSILGFWTLAVFYNWAGTHHLIGGPIPMWLSTVGIVGSLLMFVPVAAVGVNHHFTMVGHFHRLRDSPTLRFVVFGAVSYTIVSVQGSLTALRSVNETTHFTHYTIAHAHLGVYAFSSMVNYGAMYYVLPRLVRREWVSSRLISVHFWCAAVGVTLYWVGLTWGGVLQGMMMNDPEVPWIQIVQSLIPFLWSRSVASVILSVGHVAFAISVWFMIRRRGEWLAGPTLFTSKRRLRDSLRGPQAPDGRGGLEGNPA